MHDGRGCSRRTLIGLAFGMPAALTLGGRALAEPAACVDLETLPMSQKGRRRALGFKVQSPDPKRNCGACSFFTGTAGGCGKCQMLSGGAVAAGNVCDSFAARG